MHMDYIDEITRKASEMLSPKRLEHTMGVRNTGLELAKLYNGDEERIVVASMCHDLFRGKSGEELDALITEYCLPERYLGNANLAHGKLAEKYAEKELGIEDRDILNAISYHTTGRKDMSLTERIVFLADAIEPGRDYPLVTKLKDTAFQRERDLGHSADPEYPLNKACLMALEGTIKQLVDSGMNREDIDRDTLEAYEYYLTKEKETK